MIHLFQSRFQRHVHGTSGSIWACCVSHVHTCRRRLGRKINSKVKGPCAVSAAGSIVFGRNFETVILMGIDGDFIFHHMLSRYELMFQCT